MYIKKLYIAFLIGERLLTSGRQRSKTLKEKIGIKHNTNRPKRT